MQDKSDGSHQPQADWHRFDERSSRYLPHVRCQRL